MATIAELTALALQIRNETNPGANTAVRIGDMLLDLIDTLAERTQIPIPAQRATPVYSVWQSSGPLSTVSSELGGINFQPIILPVAITFSQYQFYNSVISTGSLLLGLYESANGEPTDLVSGSSTGNTITTTGSKTPTLGAPLSIPAGLYFIGLKTTADDATIQGSPTGVGAPLLITSYSSSVPLNNRSSSFYADDLSAGLPADASALTLQRQERAYHLQLF